MSYKGKQIRKTTFGRWEVIGMPAAFGHSDNDQTPVCPPSFKTKRAAMDFIDRNEDAK